MRILSLILESYDRMETCGALTIFPAEQGFSCEPGNISCLAGNREFSIEDI